MLQVQPREIRVRPPQGVSLEEIKSTLYIIEEEEDDFYYELSDTDLKEIELSLFVKYKDAMEEFRKHRSEKFIGKKVSTIINIKTED